MEIIYLFIAIFATAITAIGVYLLTRRHYRQKQQKLQQEQSPAASYPKQ